MKILVTGAAGFIGCELSLVLMARGDLVVGIDNLNDYYDVALKTARLERLQEKTLFQFERCDLSDAKALERVFEIEGPFDAVVNLAAQAGVRYSLKNPRAYVESNLVGFANLLEVCRHYPTGHLVFGSSSSVYGANTKMPFSVHDNVNHPVSLYAATKKSNELMAHSYSHLYNIPTIGLRFFTVYGPWGRPDMAYFSFTKAIYEGKPIKIFNHGKMQRDFTYIDDIVEAVVRVIDQVPQPNSDWDGNNPDSASSFAPYRLYNIGNHQPEPLMKMIELLEKMTGKEAIKEYVGMQPGDVKATYADVDDLIQAVKFSPSTSLETGLERFIEWYRSFYQIC